MEWPVVPNWLRWGSYLYGWPVVGAFEKVVWSWGVWSDHLPAKWGTRGHIYLDYKLGQESGIIARDMLINTLELSKILGLKFFPPGQGEVAVWTANVHPTKYKKMIYQIKPILWWNIKLHNVQWKTKGCGHIPANHHKPNKTVRMCDIEREWTKKKH